jgi:cation diffusion facilitator CzcD-associated flavoprotein CzcO
VTTNGATATEHVDVLIVGAGLSGVGAACHLRRNLPGKSFTILESRDDMGGTWDLFRYPGIRSDSDMFTLGYSFRPWTQAEAIADGPAIWRYIHETARDYGVEEKIRFGHRVVRAEWSTPDARWTVHAERTDTGEPLTLTCDFLFACTGYYRYDEGYTPDFAGMDSFRGEIVHPQFWPEDLDYDGKRVVVIGSGATAVTLLPSMSERAAHVTMLQRSPSYVVSLPEKDGIAMALRRRLGAKAAYAIVRWKNVLRQMLAFHVARRWPRFSRRLVRKMVSEQLPEGYDVDTHFNPTYEPWDQRLCLVPDGDMFEAIASGRASIVTDRIKTFTERGLELEAGKELEADLIVTATGFHLLLLGGMDLVVDGAEVDFSERVAYKGMMLSGVPNMAMALGYTNASWTLKCDLVAQHVCRLLDYMDRHGYAMCTPQGPDPSLPTEPLIDLKSGYVDRAMDRLPRQGPSLPWRLHQNYFRDVRMLKRGPVDDSMTFARPAQLGRADAMSSGKNALRSLA